MEKNKLMEEKAPIRYCFVNKRIDRKFLSLSIRTAFVENPIETKKDEILLKQPVIVSGDKPTHRFTGPNITTNTVAPRC